MGLKLKSLCKNNAEHFNPRLKSLRSRLGKRGSCREEERQDSTNLCELTTKTIIDLMNHILLCDDVFPIEMKFG